MAHARRHGHDVAGRLMRFFERFRAETSRQRRMSTAYHECLKHAAENAAAMSCAGAPGRDDTPRPRISAATLPPPSCR